MTAAINIALFEESRDDIDISVTAQIDFNGNLSIRGYDCGKLVMELKGRGDYEYILDIKKPDKEILIKQLAEDHPHIQDDKGFMKWLQSNYSDNQGFSKFLALVTKMGIKKEVFFWP